MQSSSFILFLCITGFQISHEYALDRQIKQRTLEEKIVQLLRSSLSSDDKRESGTCPTGMDYDEATERCKCFDENSVYNEENKKCQCNNGFKEFNLTDNRIVCFKYDDGVFDLPGMDG